MKKTILKYTITEEEEKQKEFERGLTSTILGIGIIISLVISTNLKEEQKEEKTETKNETKLYKENNVKISKPLFENIKFIEENQR